jgi:hypothetical protein
VLTHELLHIVHLDEARGLVRVARHVLGRAPFLFPNAFTPTWMIEGLATYEETQGTAFGRGRNPDVRMVCARRRWRSSSWAKTRPSAGLDRWPAGQAAYFFGEASWPTSPPAVAPRCCPTWPACTPRTCSLSSTSSRRARSRLHLPRPLDAVAARRDGGVRAAGGRDPRARPHTLAPLTTRGVARPGRGSARRPLARLHGPRSDPLPLPPHRGPRGQRRGEGREAQRRLVRGLDARRPLPSSTTSRRTTGSSACARTCARSTWGRGRRGGSPAACARAIRTSPRMGGRSSSSARRATAASSRSSASTGPASATSRSRRWTRAGAGRAGARPETRWWPRAGGPGARSTSCAWIRLGGGDAPHAGPGQGRGAGLDTGRRLRRLPLRPRRRLEPPRRARRGRALFRVTNVLGGAFTRMSPRTDARSRSRTTPRAATTCT